MHVKREMSSTSTIVSNDPNVNKVSESIKRMAISRERVNYNSNRNNGLTLQVPPLKNQTPILSVMSRAKDDFDSKYEVIREIGKGGFSTVYLCKRRFDGNTFAVKIVDLRPLRLRERFNPARLKREVDIMSRLRHPNIIQFVDVFEDADSLMLIMEFCPGRELFDVILEKSKFSEEDAKPVFAQIAKALYYLHNLNIIHRDIKPENILIADEADPVSGQVIAKLLDFGLSKNAGAGSAAKTFVGTPCYLAPEVEYTAKGLGGTYGLPADCWSIGAVLYVMLVARFPEFEQDPYSGKVVVKLTPQLWSGISDLAKELIRSLMNTNPVARMTMAGALQHQWLGKYRCSQQQLTQLAVKWYDFGQGLQEEEERFAREQEMLYIKSMQAAPMDVIGNNDFVSSTRADDRLSPDFQITAGGAVVPAEQHAMVLRQSKSIAMGVPSILQSGVSNQNNGTNPQNQLQLTPLLNLQRNIALCFEEAHATYHYLPEVATQIRKAAALCREQLTESTKMLRKVEQTAASVLNMFPDLELAVEEGEPALAAEFFSLVKGWVVELREVVKDTQRLNKVSMEQIQHIVEDSTAELTHRHEISNRPPIQSNGVIMPKRFLETLLSKLNISATNINQVSVKKSGDDLQSSLKPDDQIELNADQVLELFVSLFGSNNLQTVHRNDTSSLDFHRETSIESGDRAESDYDRKDSNSNSNNTISSLESDMMVDHDQSSIQSSPIRTFTKSVVPDNQSSQHSNQLDEMRYTNDADMVVNDEVIYNYSNSSAISSNTTTQISSINKSINDCGTAAATAGAVTPSNNQSSHSNQTTVSPNPFPLLITNSASDQGTTVSKQWIMTSSGAMNGSVGGNKVVANNNNNNTVASTKLGEALEKLRKVDVILEQLSIFWANTEVVLDLLTKKGQHVEQFIHFSQKPKLLARFKERMEEYKRFWEGVSSMATNYITGVHVQQTNPEARQRMYGFLERSKSGHEMNIDINNPSSSSSSQRSHARAESFEDIFHTNLPYEYQYGTNGYTVDEGSVSGKSVA